MATKKTSSAMNITEEEKAALEEIKNMSAEDMLQKFAKEGGQHINPDILFHKFVDKDNQTCPLQGILLERRKRRDVEQFYYIVCLTSPAVLWDSEGNQKVGKAGDFAWVDERWAISSLQAYLPKGKVNEHTGEVAYHALNEVLIVPTEKKDIGGGKTAWRAKVMGRSVNPQTVNVSLIAPKASAPPPQLGAKDEDMGDVPF